MNFPHSRALSWQPLVFFAQTLSNPFSFAIVCAQGTSIKNLCNFLSAFQFNELGFCWQRRVKSSSHVFLFIFLFVLFISCSLLFVIEGRRIESGASQGYFM
jgi:hypothetical protein